jgi:hypothetical protein
MNKIRVLIWTIQTQVILFKKSYFHLEWRKEVALLDAFIDMIVHVAV